MHAGLWRWPELEQLPDDLPDLHMQQNTRAVPPLKAWAKCIGVPELNMIPQTGVSAFVPDRDRMQNVRVLMEAYGTLPALHKLGGGRVGQPGRHWSC